MQLTLLTTIALCVSWSGGGTAQEYYFGDGDFPSDGGEDIQVSYRELDDEDALHDVGYAYIDVLKERIRDTINLLFVQKQEVDQDGYKGSFTIRPISILDVDLTYDGLQHTPTGLGYIFKLPVITVVYDFDFFLEMFGDLKGSFSILINNPKIIMNFKISVGRTVGFKEDTLEFKHDQSDMKVTFDIDTRDFGVDEGKVADLGKQVINTFVQETLGKQLIDSFQTSIANLTTDEGKPTIGPTHRTTRTPPRPGPPPPPPPPTSTDVDLIFLEELKKLLNCKLMKLPDKEDKIKDYYTGGDIHLFRGLAILDLDIQLRGRGSWNEVQYRLPKITIRYSYTITPKDIGYLMGTFEIVLLRHTMKVEIEKTGGGYDITEGVQILTDKRNQQIHYNTSGGTLDKSKIGWAEGVIQNHVKTHTIESAIVDIERKIDELIESITRNGGRAPYCVPEIDDGLPPWWPKIIPNLAGRGSNLPPQTYGSDLPEWWPVSNVL